MNAMTARGLSLAVVVAVWTAISHVGKLDMQLWPVIVGLACFVAAGSGAAAFQKSAVGTVTGVVWALLYVAVSGALGHQALLDALVLGAAMFGIVAQSRVPVLGYTAGVIAGAGVTMGALGIRTLNVQGGIRVAIALVIGCGLGYGAEYVAGMLKKARPA